MTRRFLAKFIFNAPSDKRGAQRLATRWLSGVNTRGRKIKGDNTPESPVLFARAPRKIPDQSRSMPIEIVLSLLFL